MKTGKQFVEKLLEDRFGLKELTPEEINKKLKDGEFEIISGEIKSGNRLEIRFLKNKKQAQIYVK